jgi:hypothetical protein
MTLTQFDFRRRPSVTSAIDADPEPVPVIMPSLPTPVSEPKCPVTPDVVIFLRWLSSTGISLRSITNADFMEFIQQISLKYKPPSRYIVRKQLVAYGNYLRDLVLWKLKGKSVSLIADGATWEDRALYFVVAFTPRNIHFLDILHLDKTNHTAIAEEMGKIVTQLNAGETKVRSVTTDNASNLRRALDPTQITETLQVITKQPILHVRCGIHTAHLAFEDLERESLEFVEFKSYLTGLLTWLRKPEHRNQLRDREVTCKIPRIVVIKWCTY